MSTSSLYDLETLFLEKLQEKYKLNIRDVKRAFARFDLDQNGLLDLSEMVKGVQTFLNGVKETQVKSLVDCYDVNGDGKISYEEFLHFLTTRSAIDPYDEEAEELPDEEYYAPVSANRGGSRGGGRPGSRQGGYQDEGYSQASSRYRDEDNASYRSGGQYSDASYHPHYAEDDRSQGRGRAAAPVQRAQAAPVGRGRAPANGAARKEAWQDRETYSEVGTDIVPSSEVPSTLNEGNPRELENRAKVFIHNLKNALSKKASDMRLSGKVRMPTMMTIPELHESVARDLLAKQFQPFTGEGDGRVRGKAFGVEFSDFAKVLRSYNFPGTTPIRTETIQYIFDICSLSEDGVMQNEEGRVVADAEHLLDLVFGTNSKSKKDQVVKSGKAVDAVDAPPAVDPISGRPLKNFISKLEAGRNIVGYGPVKVVDPVDAKKERQQELLAVPLRFVSRKSRTALAVPSNFDPNAAIPRSNSMPNYGLSRKHVFGLSTTRYSGNTIYAIPTPDTFGDLRNQRRALPDTGRPTSARTHPDFIDNSTLVYASAGLGVVHNLQNNTQLFHDGHSDDITCITVSNDGQYVATGCMGKNAVVQIWSTNVTDSQKSLATIGKGFFNRGVCAIEFSWDIQYLIGIGCDDMHLLGIFDLRTSEKVCEVSSAHGIPPQIKWMSYCPGQQHTEYITREHAGLCDLFATAGDHHLRIWSFRRPTGSQPASLQYKGPTMGKAGAGLSAPKQYTCCSFVYCEDKTFDLVAGGSNGMMYMWRKGVLTASCQAIRGKVQCMVVLQDKVYCGGAGGVVKVLDARTLNSLRQFNLLGEVVSTKATRPGSRGGLGRPSSATPSQRMKGMQARPASAGRQGIASARAPSNVNPSHAAGAVTRPSIGKTPFGTDDNNTDLDAKMLAEANDETGARNIIGLTVVPGVGRGGTQGLYVICALATGKMVRIDIGNITANSSAAGSDYYGKDLFYYHTGPVYGLAADVTSSKRLCATVGDDRKLMVWDVQDCVLLGKQTLKGPSRCCHLDKTNSFVAVGSNAGTVTVYFLTDHLQNNASYYKLEEVAFRKDCKADCLDIKFSPTNDMLAVGSRDDCIYIYGCNLVLSESGRGAGIHTVGTCTLKAMHRLKGHSSYITHLDWSYDSRLLQSTCGAYELLCWDIDNGRLNTAVNAADVRWKTQHCVLGFPVMGIWPPYSDGTDINAIDASKERGIVVTANDANGLIRLLNYPSIVKNAPAKEYTGHSSHVTNIRMMRDGETVISTGGNDGAVMIFSVVPE